MEGSPGGETLKFCYQCGTCTAACPISKFIKFYRPNKILELAKLGIRGLPQSSAFLFCSACTLCTKGCPQGVKVHEIMQALKELAPEDADVKAFLAEGFDDTLEALGEGMPFPVSYSWICLRPDQGEMGPAIMEAFWRTLNKPAPITPTEHGAMKVAVIGSGPAGMTAAWDLAKAGVAVTVFERHPELGGTLRAGIPSFRMPKDIVDIEIAKIKALGVETQANTLVDAAFFTKLLEDFSAVFVASGALWSRLLHVEGENLAGVVPALDFLRDFNYAGKVKAGKNVVVIGGGNVATDAAGTALRCGAESVKLFCLEDRKAMPAHEWEIEDIAAAGVELHPGWGVKEIKGEDGKVTGLRLIKCVSVFDENKRFSPKFDEMKILDVEADMVITAIGQAPDLSFLHENVDQVRGAIEVDPYTMETSFPGVFAGGDAIAGTSLVEAIATGKTAAGSILRYLDERRAMA